MSKRIKVVLVDDHMVVRKGLVSVIQSYPDINVVGEAENGEEALLLCHQLHPDVVLMDVKMEGMGGVAATKIIRQFYPKVRVVALSTFPDADMVRQMLDSEANGYILKNITAKELTNTIRSVHAGETIISPEVSQTLEADKIISNSPDESDIKLSKQQKKVLALLTQGLSNTKIANKLNISPPTARYHVSAILLKLGVSNRVEAATLAVKQNLVEN